MNKDQVYSALGEVSARNMDDPGTGRKLPAAGVYGHMALAVGSGAETNTLADPDHPGQQLSLTVYSLSGGTRAITCATKIDTTPHTIITFSAVDQHVTLLSVPYSGNATRSRWQVDINQGATLS